MAAGDVKLLAAVGSVLGPIPAVLAGGVTLFAGAALGVFAMLVHKDRAQDQALQDPAATSTQTAMVISRRKQRLPYAAAIAAGAVGGLLYSGRLQDFFGALI